MSMKSWVRKKLPMAGDEDVKSIADAMVRWQLGRPWAWALVVTVGGAGGAIAVLCTQLMGGTPGSAHSLFFIAVIPALFGGLAHSLTMFGKRDAFRRIARNHGYDVCPSCNNGMIRTQVAERCPACGMVLPAE